jgi:CO dehydrogenase/acetyl-CoA synthase alpha subunit
VFRNRLARGIKNDLGMKNEMKIGEILPFGFKKIKCVELEGTPSCDSCCSCSVEECLLLKSVLGACDRGLREDGENVFFQIVEE